MWVSKSHLLLFDKGKMRKKIPVRIPVTLEVLRKMESTLYVTNHTGLGTASADFNPFAWFNLSLEDKQKVYKEECRRYAEENPNCGDH